MRSVRYVNFDVNCVICFGESRSIHGPGMFTYNTWIWHGYSQKVCIIWILGSSNEREYYLKTPILNSKPFTLNHQVTLETTTVFYPQKRLPGMRFQTGIGWWYCIPVSCSYTSTLQKKSVIFNYSLLSYHQSIVRFFPLLIYWVD